MVNAVRVSLKTVGAKARWCHANHSLVTTMENPQGAPSKKMRQKQDGVNDNDDDDEYVQGNYLSLVQIM